MAPTLEDQDRLIVNKLVYRIGEPRRGDIVMLYYPLNPDKSFVKRVIAEEGDTVRIVDGRVYVNDVPLHDDYVPTEFRSHDDWGPTGHPGRATTSSWATTGTTARTAGTGAWCRRSTSSARCSCAGGRCRRHACSDGIGRRELGTESRGRRRGRDTRRCARVLTRVLFLNLARRRRQDRVRLRERRHQHPVRRLSLPHRRRLERRRPGRRHARPAGRPTRTIRTVTASTRRWPRRRSRCSCCSWSSRCCGTRSTTSTGRSTPPDISLHGFVVMVVTVGVNLCVIRYESREAERLGSEVLLADAMQTRGDVWTSLTVIVALAGARAGRADSRPDRRARRRRLHRLRRLSDRHGDDAHPERSRWSSRKPTSSAS